LKEDTRSLKELQNFCDFIKEKKGIDGYTYILNTNGLHMNTDFSIGKILWLLRNNKELQRDLSNPNIKEREKVTFGTIESYMI